MSTATLAAAGVAGECNVLTPGAYRFAALLTICLPLLLVVALTAADFSPACGQLEGFLLALHRAKCLFLLAEAVRFELTKGFPLLVFKTSAIDHSATPPTYYLQQISRLVHSTALPTFQRKPGIIHDCAFDSTL